MSTLKIFINQVDSFMNKLLDLLKGTPEESSVKIYYEKFKLGRSVNPVLIIENIIKILYNYKEYIFNKDEKYFVSVLNDKCDEINKYDSMFASINFITLMESNISENAKDSIWKYLQVFCVLMEKYIIEKYPIAEKYPHLLTIPAILKNLDLLNDPTIINTLKNNS
jgi:hypothetical protein